MRASQLERPSQQTPAVGSDAAHTVVAVVVEWRGRIGLFRRSQSVGHDRGRWHCITGYLNSGNSPEQQALQELFEETGLCATDLDALQAGASLRLDDAEGNLWTVHTFRATTECRRLRINEEHDAYRWVVPRAVARFSNRVTWLQEVLDAVER